ncbi:HIRA-interacting protein 5 [Suhomyces tanzawaensis NRRL Y-17324]|uniref:HIRA-interacting protein 5 n=1 Tax=Suhomyces tanzawaensis NRRL Y-17324 TaxID=984487 RepID=A0A1E4SM25_9ASCO|nr:HIRA-interacting protein 5 [Suhomyces tanzawaensis NRRL Y-17324]ODV80563.1 HIRA-interacting protein 5 [Suhomyces tanzawaensis NRRL Y-17324]
MFLVKRSLPRAFQTRVGASPFSACQAFRNLFIQTAETPNEQALKFLPSMKILADNETREFLSGREAACSPLALKLFTIDGVKSIMFGSNFITIEKADQATNWSLLKPEIFSILTEYLTNGTPIIVEDSSISSDMEISEDDDEIVSMIKELIFTRIRPAIQDDGGDIEFVNFEETTGTVYLRLKGACRSCDSSSVTLKNGIESMLKYYIEEVQAVEPVDDGIENAQEVQEEPAFDIAAHLTPRIRSDPPNL